MWSTLSRFSAIFKSIVQLLNLRDARKILKAAESSEWILFSITKPLKNLMQNYVSSFSVILQK